MRYPELKDKVVIVTGGSSGIGRATALAFAGNGAKVVVSARSEAGCRETCKLISDDAGTAIPAVADVSQTEQIESLVALTEKEFGGLDIAFNNAGTITDSKMCFDESEDEWDRVMNTNLKSVWAMMKYEIPAMMRGGKGTIVNTASVAGVRAAPTYAIYAASKAGVNSLTASVAREVAAHNIRVNAISPGFINTAMSNSMDPQVQQMIDAGIPMGRRGEPGEVADLVLWLCSDQSDYLTGQSLLIDGGSAT